MTKDFFISHSRKDRHWAEWIAWQLEEAGYTTVLQAWDFRPGTNFTLEITQLIESAQRIIVLLSPAYLESEYVQAEWQAAIAKDPTGQKNTLLPIRVEICELRGLFSSMVYLDLVGLSPDDARNALLEAVRPFRAKPVTAPNFPGAPRPNSKRNKPTPETILAKKIETGDYDIFLCHSSRDKAAVKEIGRKLKENGVLPWLDEWEIRPGTDWQAALENQIKNIRCAGVFVGAPSFGPWQDLEKKAFLQQFLTRGSPVIPVILAGYEGELSLPPFLSMLHYVDFREHDPDPMEQLIWGITGKKPDSF